MPSASWTLWELLTVAIAGQVNLWDSFLLCVLFCSGLFHLPVQFLLALLLSLYLHPVVMSAYCSQYIDSYSPGCCQEDLWACCGERKPAVCPQMCLKYYKNNTVLEKRETSENYIHEGFLHKQAPPLRLFLEAFCKLNFFWPLLCLGEVIVFNVNNYRSLAISGCPEWCWFLWVFFFFVLFWFDVNRNTTLTPDCAGACNSGIVGSIMASKSTMVCVLFTAWLLFCFENRGYCQLRIISSYLVFRFYFFKVVCLVVKLVALDIDTAPNAVFLAKFFVSAPHPPGPCYQSFWCYRQACMVNQFVLTVTQIQLVSLRRM